MVRFVLASALVMQASRFGLGLVGVVLFTTWGCSADSQDLFESDGEPRAGTASAGGDSPGAGAGGTVNTTGGRSPGGGGTGGVGRGGEAQGGTGHAGRTGNGGSSASGRAGAASGGASKGGAANGGASKGGSGGAHEGGAAGMIGEAGSGGISFAGAAGMSTCTDPDGGDVTVRGTTKGTNGTFTDSCTAEGDLTEYSCEVKATGAAIPCVLAPASEEDARLIAPPGCGTPTGKVVSTLVSCGGLCKEGRCNYWCPTPGQELEYQAVVNGAVSIENHALDFRYECEVVFARDDYDCASELLVGETTTVFSTGSCNASSIVFGTSSSEDPAVQDCTYSCTLEVE